MSAPPSHGVVSSLPAWACRLLAVVLILGSTGCRLAYLSHDCPLDLAPDEAHYWDWSRHLDWSYYSKGPLVAYLIRGACELAGPWSEGNTGNLMFAVRLPAVVCGALMAASLYVLTVQVFRREPLALAVVALTLTLPPVAAGSAIMTIDAPYTCCWGWALVLGRQAIFRGSGWAWPAAGLVVGLGILAKYTMVLWLPSVGLFLLASRDHRRLLLRPGFWTATVVAALCCLPIVVWNIQNGWVTFHHVFNLSGLNAPSGGEGHGIHWTGPLHYFGGQCALLLGFWFVVWLAAMVHHNPLKEADAGMRYLWWLSAPMFLTFFAFSFKTGGGELNWPVTAYLSGMVLGGAWLTRQLQSPVAWYRRATAACTTAACVLGLTITVVMHHTDWARPVLEPLSGPASPMNQAPLRRFDPTCRLRGWRTLAAAVDDLRTRLTAEEGEPILAAGNWSLPGELGFYCSGHPQAYSIGLAVGDRHSQYDLWRNPLDDAETFRGRTFLVVGGPSSELKKAFDSVGEQQEVRYCEGGRLIACWTVTVCRGYRGFPPELWVHNHSH